MKHFAVTLLLVAALALVGCGSNSSSTPANINGTWNATLVDSNSQTYFQFGTSLKVNGDNSLTISNLTITAPSPCFGSAATESGSFVLSGNFNGKVTGTFQFVLTSASPSGNTLTLNGSADGNTISGNWSTSGSFGCTGNGTFTMTKM
ncbi:MAG TPA: hypothetical protein VMH04_08440 [Candidatus Solibacter sp.]|nr:hypothetical protein [Candidatus Solibacter sp.]